MSPVGQLSDPFSQGESEDLGFTFSGLPGEPDEPEPEERDGGDGGNGVGDGDEVVFELDDWSEMERQAASDRLREATIPHVWDGTDLHVAAEDEAAVDNILDIVDGGAEEPRLDDDRDRVAYDLGDWDEALVDRLVDLLREGDLAYEWDGEELYVYAEDEQAVDELLDRAGSDDGAAAGAASGVDGAELLGDLFVAADRLQHDGTDNEGTFRMLESGRVVEEAAAPYGMDKPVWEGLQERVAVLVDLLIEDTIDQDEVRSQAHDLRSALRPFV
jgi:hypothetical protein